MWSMRDDGVSSVVEETAVTAAMMEVTYLFSGQRLALGQEDSHRLRKQETHCDEE